MCVSEVQCSDNTTNTATRPDNNRTLGKMCVRHVVLSSSYMPSFFNSGHTLKTSCIASCTMILNSRTDHSDPNKIAVTVCCRSHTEKITLLREGLSAWSISRQRPTLPYYALVQEVSYFTISSNPSHAVLFPIMTFRSVPHGFLSWPPLLHQRCSAWEEEQSAFHW